jgi:hypothetical protein
MGGGTPGAHWAVRYSGVLEYPHQRAHDEPLRAIPDVVAWCWARSGDWRQRVAPILGAMPTV